MSQFGKSTARSAKRQEVQKDRCWLTLTQRGSGPQSPSSGPGEPWTASDSREQKLVNLTAYCAASFICPAVSLDLSHSSNFCVHMCGEQLLIPKLCASSPRGCLSFPSSTRRLKTHAHYPLSEDLHSEFFRRRTIDRAPHVPVPEPSFAFDPVQIDSADDNRCSSIKAVVSC